MMHIKHRFIGLWLCLVVILSACVPVTAPTATLSPTAIPITHTPLPVVELPQTLTGLDLFNGTLTLNYPANWVLQGTLQSPNGVQIYSDAQLAAQGVASDVAMPTGSVAGIILVLNDIGARDLIPPRPYSPEGLVETFIGSLRSVGSVTEFSRITTQNYGGEAFARSVARTPLADTLLLAADKGEAFVLFSFNSAPNELNQLEAIANAMLYSARYTPPSGS